MNLDLVTIVHVDGGEQQLSLLTHLDKSVNTRRGLSRHTDGSVRLPSLGIFGKLSGKNLVHDLELRVIGGGRIRKLSGFGILLLGLDSLVDKKSHVTTVIDDKIGTTSFVISGPRACLKRALPVLLESLPSRRKREHRQQRWLQQHDPEWRRYCTSTI